MLSFPMFIFFKFILPAEARIPFSRYNNSKCQCVNAITSSRKWTCLNSFKGFLFFRKTETKLIIHTWDHRSQSCLTPVILISYLATLYSLNHGNLLSFNYVTLCHGFSCARSPLYPLLHCSTQYLTHPTFCIIFTIWYLINLKILAKFLCACYYHRET